MHQKTVFPMELLEKAPSPHRGHSEGTPGVQLIFYF